jgi:molybdopterin-synthase adenylyltransferase
MNEERPLTDEDRAAYQWQMWVSGFGEEGQRRLKNAAVLVTRVGGVGGNLAQQLAAAGIGKLVLAHAGNLRPDDLNRQILMSQAAVGQSRVEQAARRLRDINPRLEVEAIGENISAANVERLVAQVDVVACCAPLFGERLLLNSTAVRQRKPLVDCAMFELETQLTTVLPGATPCLACLYGAGPPGWQRQFPVFGAVAGTIGCLGAMEAIKVLTGLGQPLANLLLVGDLSEMTFRKVRIQRNPACPVCQGV